MDDVGSLVNHSLATPLRVVGKEQHSISLGGYWRPKVVLKVLRWSKGSFSPSNGSSYGKWNFEGEFVLLTILSKLRSVFSLIAFFSSSISFLISLRRSELAPSRVPGHLFWLSLSSSRLVSKRLSSCCSRNLISWFCLVSSSTVVASVWIYRANAARSWLTLDSIWTCELRGTMLSNLGAKKVVSHRRRQTDDAEIVNQNDRLEGKPSIANKILKR